MQNGSGEHIDFVLYLFRDYDDCLDAQQQQQHQQQPHVLSVWEEGESTSNGSIQTVYVHLSCVLCILMLCVEFEHICAYLRHSIFIKTFYI